jgi:hypothetical protein
VSELEYPQVEGVAPGNGYTQVVTGTGQVFGNVECCLASVGAVKG